MNQETIIKGLKKYSKIIGSAVLGVVVVLNSYGYNDSGVSTRLQQPVIGHKWIKEEGYYFKLPFISRTRSYNQKGTVASSDDENIVNTASLTTAPRNMQFADSYEMRFEWTMRYEIPLDDEGLEQMHTSLKSEENLLGNTVMPFAQTLVNDSVNQLLGADFSQGGRNSLRTLIDNQSQFGMYQTRVEKVKTNRQSGKGSNDVTGGTYNNDLEITKVVYLKDKGGKNLRTPLALNQYGLKIVPNSITIIETQPLGRLVKFIETKQKNITLQIEQDEQQKLLSKQAKTSKLQGEKDLIDRTNTLNIAKQEAIIAAERKVEEAKLQAEKETVERQKVADLAIIDKKRELQVAKSNEGIQSANAKAAKYEAQAIKEKGFAEAEVDRAKLKAKSDNENIYLAELDRDIQVKMAEVLPQVKITSPQIVMGGNGGGNQVSDLLSTKLVQDVINNSKVKTNQ